MLINCAINKKGSTLPVLPCSSQFSTSCCSDTKNGPAIYKQQQCDNKYNNLFHGILTFSLTYANSVPQIKDAPTLHGQKRLLFHYIMKTYYTIVFISHANLVNKNINTTLKSTFFYFFSLFLFELGTRD